MSEQGEGWADGAYLRVNCASKASSLSASGASLADVRALRSGARTFSLLLINLHKSIHVMAQVNKYQELHPI